MSETYSMSNYSWSDDSSEEEEIQQKNENSLPAINDTFRNNVLKVKHSLYENIVLSPELGTVNAQDNQVLQHYLNKLNKVYIMSLRAENGKIITEEELLIFPKESREVIRSTLDWINDFFKKNHISVTIPYSDYIRKSFHDYQFVQNNSFDGDE